MEAPPGGRGNKLWPMPEPAHRRDDRGVGDALRQAIERTLQATAPAAAQTRERAGELLDEVARRGREARSGITRRGQDAGAEVARRVETLERRLAVLEDALRGREGSGRRPDEGKTEPKAEG